MNEKIYTQEDLNAAVNKAIYDMTSVLKLRELQLKSIHSEINMLVKDHFKTKIEETPLEIYDFDIIEDILNDNKSLCYKIDHYFDRLDEEIR